MQPLYLHIDDYAAPVRATMITVDPSGLRIRCTISLDLSSDSRCRGQISEYIPGRGFVALLDLRGHEGPGANWHGMRDGERGEILRSDRFPAWLLDHLNQMDRLGRSIVSGQCGGWVADDPLRKSSEPV